MENKFSLIDCYSENNFHLNSCQYLNILDLNQTNDLVLNFYFIDKIEANINLTSLNYLSNQRKIVINIFINEQDLNITFNANVLALNNTKAIIEINAYSSKPVNGKIDLAINGIIDSKDAAIVAIPKFIFNHNLLDAKHGVIIGSVNFKELIYLMNRGINKEEAKFMLISSRLFSCLSNLSSSLKKEYEAKILNIWKEHKC